MKPTQWTVVTLVCGVITFICGVIVFICAVIASVDNAGPVSAQPVTTGRAPTTPATPGWTAADDVARDLQIGGLSCERTEPHGDGVLGAAQCMDRNFPFWITSYSTEAEARAAAKKLYEDLQSRWQRPLVITRDTWVIDASSNLVTGNRIARLRYPGATLFGF